MTKRLLMGAALPLTLMLAACGDATVSEETAPAAAPETVAEAPAEAPMPPVAEADRDALFASILADEDRLEGHSARDAFRNPQETIEFFGIEPSDTVVEIWPGGGWYTEILTRYLATDGGTLVAAAYDPASEEPRVQQAVARLTERYVDNPEEYGSVVLVGFSNEGIALPEQGTVDAVLTFRNVHNFQMGGWAPEAFASFYAALKPGGVLGVVDHRLPEDADVEREQSSGYMKVSTVRALAEAAGFVFDGETEINANPNDDTNHPFGVWTLPPVSRTSGRDGSVPEGFDPEQYLAIGESDRMTLRFVKPAEPEAAALE